MSDISLTRVRGEAVLQVEPEIAVLTAHLRARDTDRRAGTRTTDRTNGRPGPLHRDGTR